MSTVRATDPLGASSTPSTMARVSGRAGLRRWTEAALLIGAPLLAGVMFYLAGAPDPGTSVFVETNGANYALPAYAAHTSGSADGSGSPAALASGAPQSLYVVGLPTPAGRPAPKLYAFVIDAADPQFQSEVIAIPAEIHQLNRHAYRVTSPQLSQWGPGVASFELYERVIARHPGSRAVLEAAIGLEIDDGRGSRRVYALRVGPR